jgi:hypothetical protein
MSRTGAIIVGILALVAGITALSFAIHRFAQGGY